MIAWRAMLACVADVASSLADAAPTVVGMPSTLARARYDG
jgi:hypothetical protein